MKPEIHIPDEVVEAGARAIAFMFSDNFDAASISETGAGNDPEDNREGYRDACRAALTAALAEWVKCGMASESTASFSPKYGWMPDGCSNTAVLIVRTEAP